MKNALVLAPAVATPLIAGPPAKRAVCQLPKAPPRDARRAEPCRRQAIPPVIDQTPMFLVSTAGVRAAHSDLS